MATVTAGDGGKAEGGKDLWKRGWPWRCQGRGLLSAIDTVANAHLKKSPSLGGGPLVLHDAAAQAWSLQCSLVSIRTVSSAVAAWTFKAENTS